MKKNNNKKSRFVLLSFLFGLVVLLSPCSIQNSVQDVLGLEIQKNKTTFQQNSSCNATVNQIGFSKSSNDKKLLNQLEETFFKPVFSYSTTEQISLLILPNLYSQKSAVPLYILFKRLKCFI